MVRRRLLLALHCAIKRLTPSAAVTRRKHARDEDMVVKIIAGGITNRLYRLIWQDYVRTLVALVRKRPLYSRASVFVCCSLCSCVYMVTTRRRSLTAPSRTVRRNALRLDAPCVRRPHSRALVNVQSSLRCSRPRALRRRTTAASRTAASKAGWTRGRSSQKRWAKCVLSFARLLAAHGQWDWLTDAHVHRTDGACELPRHDRQRARDHARHGHCWRPQSRALGGTTHCTDSCLRH